MRRPIALLLIFTLFCPIMAYEEPYGGSTPSGTPPPPSSSPWGQESTSFPQSSDNWTIPSEENEVPPESPYVLFTAEPAHLKLFMRVDTADFYTGTQWLKTTEASTILPIPEENYPTVTVELKGGGEVSLPAPSYSSKVFNLATSPRVETKLLRDDFAGSYKLQLEGETTVKYQVSFHPPPSPSELQQVTWTDLEALTPAEIREKCLQLPESLPQEVREVAENLREEGLNPYQQILKVIEYLKTGFTYGPMQEKISRDAAWTYLRTRQGHCFHANTTLAVLLRCLGIPARVVFGYVPKDVSGGKLLYKPPGHVQVEAYLPPYGWVYFDATPPGGPSYQLDYPAESSGPEPAPPKTEIQLTFKCPERARRGQEVRFLVHLTQEGHPLQDLVTIADSPWRILARVQTMDEPVMVSHVFPRTENVGVHYLIARAEEFEADNTQLIIVEAPTSLSLYLKSTQVARGEELHFSGRLVDDFGEGVGGQTVEILLDGEVLTKVETDTNGNFRGSLSTENLSLGIHSLQATFEPPVEGYLPSNSANHNFVVMPEKEEDRPWLMLAGLGTVGVALTLFILRRKKHLKAEGPSAVLRQTLREFASAKKYRDGIIAAYHQFIGNLIGSGLYEVKTDQTARELAEELARRFKKFPKAEFMKFVEVYERAMFGKRELKEEEFNRGAESICRTLDKMPWS